ncbi:MAG: hypothetical protein ACRDNF_05315 [Streptosporangiaceae bacterium]
MRARGELAEIRAAELRFTADEAAVYLNGMMGLQLTARDVNALEARTEGWIAALQLAALSMQGRDDVAGFIAGFAGDDRYVVDYLAEEVLQRQPGRVQAFLLRTSILERLTGRRPAGDAARRGHDQRLPQRSRRRRRCPLQRRPRSDRIRLRVLTPGLPRAPSVGEPRDLGRDLVVLC